MRRRIITSCILTALLCACGTELEPAPAGGIVSGTLRYDGAAHFAFERPAITVAGPATKWEVQNQGTYQKYEPEAWWGHCNGWASYVTAEKLGAPKRDVRVTLVDGKITECTEESASCVLFRMGDVEALMSELYFSDKATFAGRRCNTDPDQMARDAHGRPTDPACRDLNPGTLHVALVGLLGLLLAGSVDSTVTASLALASAVGLGLAARYFFVLPIAAMGVACLAFGVSLVV